MLSHLRPAIVSTALFTALLGLAYPLAVAGVAQAVIDGQVRGRLLGFVGQPWVNVLAVNRALDARFPKGG